MATLELAANWNDVYSSPHTALELKGSIVFTNTNFQKLVGQKALKALQRNGVGGNFYVCAIYNRPDRPSLVVVEALPQIQLDSGAGAALGPVARVFFVEPIGSLEWVYTICKL
ncbi:hypothetical protein SCHPADRAFT_939896 [Schizopora paradoxa]|uniref:Uncharacterized protein n=1 Tax=Schizopora paradoxa TaxID=27342 RepID=A0A0H2RPY2_9AGAM|nr:hypothetical protein SCHPADRAFT_939896 [Schizopora paradoxa]